MRRSAAPSQLSGNAMKKPRFVPPGASTSGVVAESKPLAPKPGLGNALKKVIYSQHFTSPIPQYSNFLRLYISFSLTLVVQVQRSLAAPPPSKTGCDVQVKAAEDAPALSRALARVLNATESKENEAEVEYPDAGIRDYAEDNRSAGKTQRFMAETVPAVRIVISCKLVWTQKISVRIERQPHPDFRTFKFFIQASSGKY